MKKLLEKYIKLNYFWTKSKKKLKIRAINDRIGGVGDKHLATKNVVDKVYEWNFDVLTVANDFHWGKFLYGNYDDAVNKNLSTTS